MGIRLRTLRTTSEVIDALGGNIPFGEMISTAKFERVAQHVSNYRRTGNFPADSFLVVRAALEAKGLTAPAALWGITDPKASALRRAS